MKPTPTQIKKWWNLAREQNPRSTSDPEFLAQAVQDALTLAYAAGERAGMGRAAGIANAMPRAANELDPPTCHEAADAILDAKDAL